MASVVGVIRVRDLALFVPAVGMDVDPRRIPVCLQLVEQIAVLMDHEVAAPETALDVRIKPQQPRRVDRFARAAPHARPEPFHQRDSGAEPLPRLRSAGGLVLVRFHIDPQHCRDGILHGFSELDT